MVLRRQFMTMTVKLLKDSRVHRVNERPETLSVQEPVPTDAVLPWLRKGEIRGRWTVENFDSFLYYMCV